MVDIDTRNFHLNNFIKFIILQLLVFITYFYILFTQEPIIAYLLPVFLINLSLYFYLITSPPKFLNFFLIFLPISVLGFFPSFYREIFLYFIQIFGLFFL
jgi:hypothetical protein